MSRRTNRRRNEKKQNVASANGRGRKPTSSLEGFRSEVLPLHHRVLQHAQSWLQHCTRYWQLLRVKEHRLAQFLRKYLIQTVISNTILLLFFTLVGLNAPASYPPLFTFIHQFQAIAVFGITILVLYCIRVLCAGSEPEQARERKKKLDQSKKQLRSPLFFVNALSYMGSTLFLILLLLILIRPPWCPGAICPAPERVLVTHPQSVHDENLEMYLTTIQSPAYLIPNDPATYTSSSLPTEIGAQRINTQDVEAYQIVISVQNLHPSSGFGITIDQVFLTVDEASVVPDEVNVWSAGEKWYYHNNVYRVTYKGEAKGVKLVAQNLASPIGTVHLAPEETDSLVVEITSQIMIDLRFHILIEYHNDDSDKNQYLSLPNNFEVVTSNAASWFPYRLQDGHFVPDV